MPSAPKTKIIAAFKKTSAESPGSDATLEFAAETAVAAKAPQRPGFKLSRQVVGGLALAVALTAVVAAAVYWKDRWQLPTSVSNGSLRIESDPAGASVSLNGESKGITPLALSVPAGPYTLVVQSGSQIKQLPVTVTSGTATVHHVAWANPTTAPAAQTGSLSVATDPVGSQVFVDGEDRGRSPLTLTDLSVGQHRVVVRAGGTTYTRTVEVDAGATASLFIGGTGASTPGSIAVSSPVPVQVFEGPRLIGTSEMDRIILPLGDHTLDLVADSIGFRTSRTVRVVAGQTASISVEMPRAPLSINAIPWAEVFIDGTRAGETPLANLPQTLGQHEVVFRHPQLGERRLVTVVTLKQTNRISMDMRQR